MAGPALDLLPRFGLEPGRLAPEHPLPGSPERCIERWAVMDAQGGAWMLERLAPAQAPRRRALGMLLAELSAEFSANNPELAAMIPAYRPVAKTNDFVLLLDQPPHSGCWQLSPFVPGLALPRPGYLDHGWRGHAVADFLLRLQAAGAKLPSLPPAPSPDLPAYRDTLFATIDRHAPRLQPRLARYRAALADLPELLAAQPLVLAHGDAHPLNLIWGQDGLRAAIDWEFAGARPLLYDAATCLGCAGFEHPSGLTRDFALGLVLGLASGLERGGLSPDQLLLLPRMVLFSRLGWLSEWLRKGDAELLDMELDYLDILLAEADRLGRCWARA